jgi:hypothetical protein
MASTGRDSEHEPLLTNYEAGVASTVGVAVDGFGPQLQQHQQEALQEQVAVGEPSDPDAPTFEPIASHPAGCNNYASPWEKIIFLSARGERIFYTNTVLHHLPLLWNCTGVPAEGCYECSDYRSLPPQSPILKGLDAMYEDALKTEAPSTSRAYCLFYKLFYLLLNPNPYCLALCWPMQPHHVPDSNKSCYSIIVCLCLLAPFPAVLSTGFYCKGFCLPYQQTQQDFGPFGARDLATIGTWMLMLLMPLLWTVSVSTLHPTQGCAIKLWKCNRELPQHAQLRLGAYSILYFLRTMFLALRTSITGLGLILTIMAVVSREAPPVNPVFGGVAVGLTSLVGGFIFSGIVGSWLVSLVQCSQLAVSNTQYFIDQVKEVKAMGDDIESIDDATWAQKITEPANTLATGIWPLLAEYGWSIGAVALMCIVSATLTVPYMLVVWTGGGTDSDAREQPALLFGFILIFPVFCAYFPVKLSTLAGQELISAVHGMRPQGPGTKYDRVSALEDYLAGLNVGQGPGFAIFDTVINFKQLALAGGLLTTAYPIFLYIVETYA